MKRALLAVSFTLLAWSVVGCGPETPSKQLTSEELDRLADDRLKAIADDASLSDADCFKKYFDTHSRKPSVILPDSIGPWWRVNAVGDGFTIHLKDEPNPFQVGKTADDRIQSERLAIKAKVELTRQVLRHFQGRKVRSVTVSLYTQLTGDKQLTELFRAIATQADLPKLEKATGNPDAETVFDPRSAKIVDVWTVELNRYPDLEYKKR